MNAGYRFALAAASLAIVTQAAAQVVFYEREGFEGRSFTTDRAVENFARHGFNDRASSVEVLGSRWEACDAAQFGGRCVILRPGRYSSLTEMGLNDRVSSVRIAERQARSDERRYPVPPVATQVTFYEREGFAGRSFTTDGQIGNLVRQGFNDRASSVEVFGERWMVCEHPGFGGRCVALRPGRYPSLAAMGLNDRISSVRPDTAPVPAPAAARVTFYEREGFAGRWFTADAAIDNFDRHGFNDRASSVEVVGERWIVCEDAGYNGRCVVLRPGRYDSLAAMGLNDRVSSARIESTHHPEPRHAPTAYDSRRRDHERLYEAHVTSVRAVSGSAGERCWVEREQVVQERSRANVPGAIAGAIIGGILGHQVGSGRGNDVATAGGAIAGAAIGANVGRDGQVYAQDVRRCESAPSQSQVDYWDVTYDFRGQGHRVQMSAPPGTTVTVNEQGEPRA